MFTLITAEWHGLVETAQSLLIASAGTCTCVMMGELMWRAARSGVDPPSEDRAIASAESRAMLQALERHDLLLAEARTSAGAEPGESDPTSKRGGA